MNEEISIDGSVGEGGGQVLRTSLALSALTGRPFRLFNIRAGRPKPGLQAQHLTAVRAAASICGAEVKGDSLGSQELYFRPGPVCAGHYTFNVGAERASAGSATLVFQTVFLPLAMADGPSHLTLIGGTHNPWAPPFPYLERVFLPAMRTLGLQASVRLERAGYYPVGQGMFFAQIHPANTVRPLVLEERGSLRDLVIYSASSNLPEHVRKRQADRALDRLRSQGLRPRVNTEELPSRGIGSILFVEAQFEGASAGFTGLGARGKPAEKVADEACDAFLAFLQTGAPVDPHLADQIVLPLALACGASCFRTSRVTQHLLTNLQVIAHFVPIRYAVEGEEGQPGMVRMERQTGVRP